MNELKQTQHTMIARVSLILYLIIGQLWVAAGHPWEPEGRTDEPGWVTKHQRLVNQTRDHMNDEVIVFVGDSITHNWANLGGTVWDKHYRRRHAYNYGVGGDRTENVLYRIANNEFDGLDPKMIVLMIGMNRWVTNANNLIP
ncbi:unnamed protein product [Medioppia subpectinata]|uniref:SGNH hydrolase-type esterase domain-containing protein n=1 Tax=Medioppia subpectinata TaxID=1979941 RepID=A0A7R9Q376_9ACAR|nr:unnamed protein product [Medioppia subpectinata]CAG2111128.1 unnamed protein product [Medioppia subpectinata]